MVDPRTEALALVARAYQLLTTIEPGDRAGRELLALALAEAGARREWCPTEARSNCREVADTFGRLYRAQQYPYGQCPCECGRGTRCTTMQQMALTDDAGEHAS